MFYSSVEQFILKRLLICFILLSIIDMAVVGNRWAALIGLTAGTVFSAVKFCSNAAVFASLFGVKTRDVNGGLGQRTARVIFLINQIILLPFLLIAYYIGQWFFWGFVAGILTIPLLIMLNSITEAFGITKNHFGERV